MNKDQMHEFLYEALETEIGGVQVYETALRCALNEDLREEWETYLEQTQNHVSILMDVLKKLGLNPDLDTPGRQIVRHNGQSLVMTMQMALLAAKPQAAQIVAAECVVLAETKDHANWGVIGILAEKTSGVEQRTLLQAYEAVEEEEDEHLYHTRGWARELQLESLGLPAALPPPEEERDVRTAVDAARTKKERKESLRTSSKKERR